MRCYLYVSRKELVLYTHPHQHTARGCRRASCNGAGTLAQALSRADQAAIASKQLLHLLSGRPSHTASHDLGPRDYLHSVQPATMQLESRSIFGTLSRQPAPARWGTVLSAVRGVTATALCCGAPTRRAPLRGRGARACKPWPPLLRPGRAEGGPTPCRRGNPPLAPNRRALQQREQRRPRRAEACKVRRPCLVQ